MGRRQQGPISVLVEGEINAGQLTDRVIHADDAGVKVILGSSPGGNAVLAWGGKDSAGAYGVGAVQAMVRLAGKDWQPAETIFPGTILFDIRSLVINDDGVAAIAMAQSVIPGPCETANWRAYMPGSGWAPATVVTRCNVPISEYVRDPTVVMTPTGTFVAAWRETSLVSLDTGVAAARSRVFTSTLGTSLVWSAATEIAIAVFRRADAGPH